MSNLVLHLLKRIVSKVFSVLLSRCVEQRCPLAKSTRTSFNHTAHPILKEKHKQFFVAKKTL